MIFRGIHIGRPDSDTSDQNEVEHDDLLRKLGVIAVAVLIMTAWIYYSCHPI
jgi:hypothetical protein